MVLGLGCFQPSSPSPSSSSSEPGQPQPCSATKEEIFSDETLLSFTFGDDGEQELGHEVEGQGQPQHEQLTPPPEILQPLVLDEIPEDLIRFTFQELHEATKGFSEELGKGAFGDVYSGSLSSGQLVAVKRVPKHAVHTNSGRNSFLVELNCLKLVRLRHNNIIKLIGFHATDDELMLVLEKMRLGSLDQHTYDCRRSRKDPLDWITRLNVAKGIAGAFEFLHGQNVLHRDLKPANILLDEGFIPKVADFGTALLVPNSAESITSQPKGTHGYVDPLCFSSSKVSSKTDVYAFAVVLLQLLTGRKALVGQDSLVDEARPLFAGGFHRLIDPVISGAPQHQLQETLAIAESCLQKDPAERPSMADVVYRLSQI